VWFAGLGCIGLGGFHLLWNYGISLNGVAVSTVQQSIMPIILALAARLFFREPIDTRKALAILLTIGGAVFVSGIIDKRSTGVTAGGIGVGFAIPAAYAAFNLFGKKISGKYKPITILTYGFGFGALFLLPFQFFQTPYWNGVSWYMLYAAGLIIISTLLPFLLYTAILKVMQVSIAGILAMAEIPVAFLYAHILFGETFTLFQWIGTGLVIGGILMLISRNLRGRQAV
jgi:drug/metabolite transporter (DMT)-like permease